MTDLEIAWQKLETESLAFVLVRDGKVIASGDDYGVVQLVEATYRLGDAMHGASLADKVVGKAVALVAVHAKLRAVDTRLASEGAVAFLRKHGIPISARTLIPNILNRRRDGLCPMEALTQPIDDASTGVAKLREFIAARRAAAG